MTQTLKSMNVVVKKTVERIMFVIFLEFSILLLSSVSFDLALSEGSVILMMNLILFWFLSWYFIFILFSPVLFSLITFLYECVMIVYLVSCHSRHVKPFCEVVIPPCDC